MLRKLYLPVNLEYVLKRKSEENPFLNTVFYETVQFLKLVNG